MAKKKDNLKSTNFPMVPSAKAVVVAPGDGSAWLTHYDQPSEIARHAARQGGSIRQMVSLSAGTGVRGRLLGSGGPVEVTDITDPSVKREIETWAFQVAESLVLMITTSAQLDSRLPSLVGHDVEVVKVGSVRSRTGMQVTDYAIIDYGE